MTLAEILTGIQAQGYSSDTQTAQIESVRGVLRRLYGMRSWPWLVDTRTATLASGSNSLAIAGLGADVTHIRAVHAASSADSAATEYTSLDWVSLPELRRSIAEDKSQGEPEEWSREDTDILVWPRADKAYTIQAQVEVHPTLPTLTTDTVIFPDPYSDVLVWGACARLAHRQRDFGAATVAKTEFREHLTDMIRAYGFEQRANSREVETWDGWGQLDGWDAIVR